jgi:hypothetical protein
MFFIDSECVFSAISSFRGRSGFLRSFLLRKAFGGTGQSDTLYWDLTQGSAKPPPWAKLSYTFGVFVIRLRRSIFTQNRGSTIS